MTELLFRVGSHALLMCGIVPVVAIVSRCLRRPAITHALWLVVLLKFLCPGYFGLPMPEISVISTVVNEHQSEALPPAVYSETRVPRTDLPKTSGEGVSDGATVPPDRTAPVTKTLTLAGRNSPWQLILYAVSCVWVAGSFWVVCLIAGDFRRIARFTRASVPSDPRLQGFSDSIARRLRLRQFPKIMERGVSLSPLVWVPLWRGERIILLPSELLRRCDESGIQAILVHELCHLKRRDHWVRWLELLVLSVFWWHPALWWTLRKLRQAADQCCDAWVVRLLPTARHVYATSLLETIDFLAEAAIPTPQPAHGLGEVSFLNRRVRMIMKGTPKAHLSWVQRIIVTGAGVCLLALTPLATTDTGRADDTESRAVPEKQQGDSAESGSTTSALPETDIHVEIEVNGKTSQFTELTTARRFLSHYGSKLKLAEGFTSFQMDLVFYGRETTYVEPYEAWAALSQLMTMLTNIEKQGLNLVDVLGQLPEKIEKPAPDPVIPDRNRRRDGIGLNGTAGLSGAELLKKYSRRERSTSHSFCAKANCLGRSIQSTFPEHD